MANGDYKRPIFLWNLIIRKSTENGTYSESLRIYSSMFQSGVHGTNYTFTPLLKACSNLPSLKDGTIIHSHAILTGFQADVFVQTALLDMYSKCADLSSSRQVFDEIPLETRTLISWNSMISAYSSDLRFSVVSFELLNQMLSLGLRPSTGTFVPLLSSGSIFSFGQGLSLHCYTIKLGLQYDIPLSNAIMNMYLHFGRIDRIESVFFAMDEKSIVSWKTIIEGYARAGNISKSFSIINEMRRKSFGLESVVLVSLMSGYVSANNFSLRIASSSHSLILRSGFHSEESINNLLIKMYAKCGDILSARKVFDAVCEKTLLLWTSIIGVHNHVGSPEEALHLFKKMLLTNVRPNEVTLATVLLAVAEMGLLKMGEEIENYILLNGLESDLRVQTSLINMFCKCGSIEKAKDIFERVSNKDIWVYSSMINGYAIHGFGEEALGLFHKMHVEDGIKPDAAVYTSVLLACSHSNFTEAGLKYFESMRTDFGVEPTIEHYMCLVDLLGRAGKLELAMKAIEEIPVEVQARVWAPLLSACRTYLNFELGEVVSKKLLEFEPESSGCYVLMANMYTYAGKWRKAESIRRLMDDKGVMKETGWSKLEINGCYHVFIAGDRSHFYSADIYEKLEKLNVTLREAGHVL